MEKATEGTVKECPNFNPELKANSLHNAVSHTLGVDDDLIIGVLTQCTNKQRQELKSAYYTLSNRKDLEEVLKKALSGDYEKAIVAMLQTPTEYGAAQLYRSLKAGPDEMSLLEILYTRTHAEINAIKEEYKKQYKSDLGNDLDKRTSGEINKLLVTLALAGKTTPDDPTYPANFWQGRKDAQELSKLSDSDTETTIVETIFPIWMRSRAQLRVVSREYKKLTKKPLENHIRDITHGTYRKALVAMLHAACDRPAYFAERLRWSMKGIGTDENVLTRVIVSRSEIDMVQIKEIYAGKYGKTLKEAVESETSSNYGELLVALIADKK